MGGIHRENLQKYMLLYIFRYTDQQYSNQISCGRK